MSASLVMSVEILQIAKYHILSSRSDQSTTFPAEPHILFIHSICVHSGVNSSHCHNSVNSVYHHFPIGHLIWNCLIYRIFCQLFPAIPWVYVTADEGNIKILHDWTITLPAPEITSTLKLQKKVRKCYICMSHVYVTNAQKVLKMSHLPSFLFLLS